MIFSRNSKSVVKTLTISHTSDIQQPKTFTLYDWIRNMRFHGIYYSANRPISMKLSFVSIYRYQMDISLFFMKLPDWNKTLRRARHPSSWIDPNSIFFFIIPTINRIQSNWPAISLLYANSALNSRFYKILRITYNC